MTGQTPLPDPAPDDGLIARLRRLEVAIATEFGPERVASRTPSDRPRLLALLDDVQATHADLEREAGRLRHELARLDRGVAAAGAYGRARSAATARQG